MGVIWYSIGAAPGYERFIGSAEVLGGLLLLLPWTDVDRRARDVRRDVRRVHGQHDVQCAGEAVRVSSGADVDLPLRTGCASADQLVRAESPGRAGAGAALWTKRRGLTADGSSRKCVFTAWALGLEIYGGAQGWKTYGAGAPKSPLYGIWAVDSMSINGELRPPLTTDTLRYSHAVFQSLNGGSSFQKMDQTFDRFVGTIDTVKRTITIAERQRQYMEARAGVRAAVADEAHVRG